MNDYWIPISLYSENSAEKIENAITAAYCVHQWTLNRLSEEYQQHKFTPNIPEYKQSLTEYSKQERLYRGAQRFTLDQAMLKTMRWFRDTDKYTGWDIPFPPKPIPAEEYTDIDINTRKIWRKYLEEFGQISTIFGMLTLEGQWGKVMIAQAKKLKISPASLPDRWHSLTIQRSNGGYKIQFNGR